ncbi:Nn.00g010190.m01.CDS01 [Neocucurbitaria sp. VM-36]
MCSAYFDPPLCANSIEGVQCSNPAKRFACSICRLVQYCSKDCQAAHWPTHRKDTCKHELMSKDWMPDYAKEQRLPTFADGSESGMNIFGPLKYLWGQEPALDLMNLAKNEGLEDLSRNIDVLCAASGDPRHTFKTVVSLPENYVGKCTVVANDIDLDIVARTAIFLLIAGYMKREEAVPAIIHLWYSALIPAAMISRVCEKILALIEDVCIKVATKLANVPLGKTFKLDAGSSVRIVLTKEQWFKLRGYFTIPPGVTREFAKAGRDLQINNPRRNDYKQNHWYYKWPTFRTCVAKFLDDGILLPFGSLREEFDTPNPTFHQRPGVWPFRDDAGPYFGWSHEEIMEGKQLASEDMLGAQFYMLRSLLSKLCTRIRKGDIHLKLSCLDARDLPSKLKQWGETQAFDRAEVSNLCDRAYWGPAAVINHFSPLLKPFATNPHATLLLFFAGANKETQMSLIGPEKVREWSAAQERTTRYLPTPNPYVTPQWHPDIFRFHQCCGSVMFDWDTMWNRYLVVVGLRALVQGAGLKMRMSSEHGIAMAWPKRMKEETKEEFDLRLGKDATCFERYVELIRVE